MMTPRDPRPNKAIPLVLALPEGKAELIPGTFESGRPRYQREGVELDIDVTIPSDLPSWYWQGSFLRLVTAPDACGVAIYTGTFGVPGVFTQARELDRLGAVQETAPKKKVKAGKRTVTIPIEAVPEPELAYEQGVLL